MKTTITVIAAITMWGGGGIALMTISDWDHLVKIVVGIFSIIGVIITTSIHVLKYARERREAKEKIVKFTTLLAFLLFFPGCTTTQYADHDGTVLKRTSFLTKLQVTEITKETRDGTRVTIRGYVNDQIAGAAMVAESTARGVASGLKP